MSEHAQECDAWLESCAEGILFTIKSSGKSITDTQRKDEE